VLLDPPEDRRREGSLPRLTSGAEPVPESRISTPSLDPSVQEPVTFFTYGA
jgi:hypothetical protein